MADSPRAEASVAAERFDAVRRSRRLGAFALGTFHALILVWLFVMLAFGAGSLGETLDGLNTLVGLAIFAAIWLVVGAIGWIAIFELPLGTSTDSADIIRRRFKIGGIGGAIDVSPVGGIDRMTKGPE